MDGAHPALRVVEPAPGAHVPCDAAAPLFRWEDERAGTWLVRFLSQGRVLAAGVTSEPSWVPDPEQWQRVRRAAGNDPVNVEIHGLGGYSLREPVSRGRTWFALSADPVQAHLVFIRKPLPFRKAKKNPQDGQVVLGDLGSWGRPRMVMQDLPLCFNCHAMDREGTVYGMDVDYRGDKGGYLMVGPAERVVVKPQDVFSWNDFAPPEPAEYSMGLFTRFSPDGRYAATTLGETSAFVMLDQPDYSQMFFPATGRIGLADRRTGRISLLPGADLPGFAQTTPEFSPDGTTLAFARAPVDQGLVRAIRAGVLKAEAPTQTIHQVNAKYPVRFDIHTVPFNGGRGGTPQPLPGASDNGMSNYFPRYSPDGRFIAFTRSGSGMVNQPDSRLCIVQARGGQARELAANTGAMNSWHSWSPNGRWLAFASKGNSPVTEIFLTHVDEEGDASAPLRLFRFSSESMAAMVPEFTPRSGLPVAVLDIAEADKAVGDSMATDGR